MTPLVAFARLIDKRAIAALHFLFHHAAPADAMVGQLAIPLVVVERHLTFFQVLLRRLGLAPRFAAFQFVGFAFAVGVPGIEEFARVATLRLAIASRCGLNICFGEFACVFSDAPVRPEFRFAAPNLRIEID